MAPQINWHRDEVIARITDLDDQLLEEKQRAEKLSSEKTQVEESRQWWRRCAFLIVISGALGVAATAWKIRNIERRLSKLPSATGSAEHSGAQLELSLSPESPPTPTTTKHARVPEELSLLQRLEDINNKESLGPGDLGAAGDICRQLATLSETPEKISARLKKAVDYYSQAIVMHERQYDKRTSSSNRFFWFETSAERDFPHARWGRAQAYEKLGQLQEALRDFEHARKSIEEKIGGPGGIDDDEINRRQVEHLTQEIQALKEKIHLEEKPHSSRSGEQPKWWDERKDVDPYRGLYGVYAERQATTWLVQEDGSLKKEVGLGHGARIDIDVEGYDGSYQNLARDLLKENVIGPGDSVSITEGLNFQKQRTVAVDIWRKKETEDQLGTIRVSLEQHFAGSARVGKAWIVEEEGGHYCRFELQSLQR